MTLINSNGKFNNFCPLCNNHSFVEHRFGLLRCLACGLVIDRRVFEPDLDRQINEDTFGADYLEQETSFWVRWFQSWTNQRYIRNLRRSGVWRGRLLEVGVGGGSFLTAALAAGFEPEGCELSESLARRVAERTSVRLHAGKLSSLPTCAFDVICMHHVLEHVRDPVGFLREAHKRLRPGGVLHIAVPNEGAWEARLPGWNCYEQYHFAYFNRETLERVCESAGFTIEWIENNESFSGWFLALVRTAIGIRPIEMHATILNKKRRAWHRNRFAEHMYRLAMLTAGLLTWPLRVMQSRLGYGDELVALARAGTGNECFN